MTEQPYLEAHSRLVTALKLLTQAKVEVAKAQSAGKEPCISHALGMVMMAWNAVGAAKASMAKEIDGARQLTLYDSEGG